MFMNLYQVCEREKGTLEKSTGPHRKADARRTELLLEL